MSLQRFPSKTMRKRVLLADDHPLMLAGVKDLLAAHFEIVGIASDGRALVDEAKRLHPDIVVLDLHMPLLNGIEATRQITEALPGTRSILLTQQIDPSYVRAAFQAGAMGFVAKQAAPTELLEAINAALVKRYFVTSLISSHDPSLLAVHNMRENPAELFGKQLTARQREVLQLVAEGMSNAEIASTLNVSAKTVEYHKSTLMDELGIRTTAELTRYAITHGIVQ